MPDNQIQAELWADAASPSMALETIKVALSRSSPTNLHIRYEAIGTMNDLVIPEPAPALRTDNLWRTTCFELFLRSRDRSRYREFNFSPSSQWAGYEFRAYRDGMTQTSLSGAPAINTQVGSDRLIVDVRLSLDLPDEPYSLSLAAVIEERRVGKSYWALNHAGEGPDFHHPACFTLELPPPSDA
jgi:hypothetical protein